MGSSNEKKGKKKGDDYKEDAVQSVIKWHNIQGKKKKMELTNQDVYDVITDLAENVKYFAVYDGHGAKGRDAAEGLKKEIRKKLTSDKKKIAKFHDCFKVEQYFKEVYKNIQKKLSNSNDFELSGTCSISVLIVDNKMFAINVGDSRCVLGQRKGGDEKKGGEKIGIEMSIDQKPMRDDEMKRIIEKGGEVSEKIPGAPRVFRKNDDVPGLAVARSIGDIVAHEVGVSCEPEVFEKELDSDDHFIVIGSDGIWDAMSSCEVVGFIFQKMETDKENCAKLLAEECRNRWEILNLFKQKYILEINASKDGNDGVKDKGGHNNVVDIDDITCIISFINIEKDEY
jgi:integrin-linked kinase-associated serine/threonine phosphatase 2C